MNASISHSTDQQELARAVIKLLLYGAVWACIAYGYRQGGLLLAIAIATVITSCLWYFGARLDADIERGVSRWRTVPIWIVAALLPAAFSIAGNLNSMFSLFQRDEILLEQLDQAREVVVRGKDVANTYLTSVIAKDKRARVDALLSRFRSELNRMNKSGLGDDAEKILVELEKEVGGIPRHLSGGKTDTGTMQVLFQRYQTDILALLNKTPDMLKEKVNEREAARILVNEQVASTLTALDSAFNGISTGTANADSAAKNALENTSQAISRWNIEVASLTLKKPFGVVELTRKSRNADSIFGALTILGGRLDQVKTWLLLAAACLIDLLPLIFGAVTAKSRLPLFNRTDIRVPLENARFDSVSVNRVGRDDDVLYRP